MDVRSPTPPEVAGAAAEPSVEGLVERIVFQNADTAWTVARLRVEGQTELVTLVGPLPGVSTGTQLRASGRFISDPTYGQQFQVEGFVPLTAETAIGIERTLAAGLVKGVGPQTAARIVETFGLRTLEVLESTPWRLREVPGLGRAKAAQIAEAWAAQRGTREVRIVLQSHGVSPKLAARIQKTYGAGTSEVLRRNPYRLAQDVHGIGFRIADRIAQAFGVPPESPERAEAGLVHLLGELANRGHVFSPRDQLCLDGEQTLEIPQDQLGLAIERLAGRGVVVRERVGEREVVYPEPLHQAEVTTARRLAELIAQPFAAERQLGLRDPTQANDGRVQLTEEQRAALSLALQHRLLVITGGPGVGKTTLVRELAALLDPRGDRGQLAAPTGRAAKRLSEATGRQARTLHRLLEFNPKDGRFARGRERPLDADLVVVDEASMIDLPLFAALLEALPERGRLVLVGDVDQLPPVGPGAVLADLLSVPEIPAVRLTQIHRQAEHSRIVQAAHRVNAGELPQWDQQDRQSDFHVIERGSAAEAAATICELVADRIPQGLGISDRDVQVLTPRHRGEAGTQALNRALQERLNPGGAPVGATGLRVGDKVMQLRNDYDREVFNGDVGRIATASEHGLTVMFEGRPVDYELRRTDDLQLAYACTVHKAQGSEYPAVVLALLSEHHPMLQRNLVYTAITRGRRLVIVVGSRRALASAVRHGERAIRYSLLANRLRASLAAA